MITKKTLVVLAMLGMFSGFAQASEKYEVVKVWPEVPVGWHFRGPQAVAVDEAGNVYIVDRGNHCIKKFDSKGRFITKWGSPGKGEGQFGWAHGIAIDGSGNLYVTDWDYPDWKHHRIQKFTTSGQFIEVWQRNGPGVDKFDFPVDVAVGPKEEVFVLAQASDDIKSSARVEKYSPNGEFITQWSTGCPVSSLGKIAVDTQGNVYLAESRNHRMHKFDPNGKLLVTWGGSAEKEGRPGGGLLARPRGITFDTSGNVYVVSHADRVQKFTPGGQFTATWAKGFWSACDIAMDNCGNVYVVQNQIHSIAKLDSEGNWLEKWGSAGQWSAGRFNDPRGVTVDEKGSVFVVGEQNIKIQKFDSEGKFLGKWGGFYFAMIDGMAVDPWGNIYVNLNRQGSQEVHKLNSDGEPVKKWGSARKQIGPYRLPFGMAIDAAGNIYVADRDNYCVQKYSAEGKLLAKWATKGSGEGQFQNLRTLTVDASGNVFVLDRPEQLQPETQRVQKFNTHGKLVTKWTMPAASGLAADLDGNVYCTGVNGGAIRKFDPDGELISIWGKGEEAIHRWDPICVDKLGHVYILQQRGIKKFDSNGKLLANWPAEDKVGAYGFPSHPRVIAADGAGNLYLNDRSLRIWKLDPNGKVTAKFRMKLPSSQGRFMRATDIATDGSGKVYVVDAAHWSGDWLFGKPRIQKFDADGKFIAEWEGPLKAEDEFKELVSVALDASGNAYISDKRAHSILKLDSEGNLMKSWGSKGTGDGQFNMPEGIAVDKSGNVYVCDRQNCRIQKFDSDGRFLAKWGKEGSGDGEFHFPAAVALDKEGNVYVADSDNNRVQKFTAEGEFGEAPGQFNVPLGIAVDAAGNVYVSDSHNHRIQKFAPVNSR
jgi:tripartite motif-containing protein 71